MTRRPRARSIVPALCFAFSLGLTFHAWSASQVTFELVGSWSDPSLGRASSLAIGNGYAFLSSGTNGVHVINVSDPSWPTYVRTISTGGASARGVTYQGNHTFIGVAGKGGRLYQDTQDPSVPTSYSPGSGTDSYEGKVVIAPGGTKLWLLVAAGNDGLLTYSPVSSGLPLGSPSVTLFSGLSYPFRVRTEGSRVYVSDRLQGLQILSMDLSNPVRPNVLGTYRTATTDAAQNWGLWPQGNYVYLAGTTAGLRVIDVSTPTRPTLAGTLALTNAALDVVVSGDLGYVAGGPSGVHAVDVADPRHPRLAGTYPTSEPAYAVTLGGDGLVYVAARGEGLIILRPTLQTVEPPIITTPPAGLEVDRGQAFSLSVEATGETSLAYQWLRNGTVIPGATDSTYTLASARLQHGGDYTAVVTDTRGLQASATAKVRVRAAVRLATPEPLPEALPNVVIRLVVSPDQGPAFDPAEAGGLRFESSEDLVTWNPWPYSPATQDGVSYILDFQDGQPTGRFFRVSMP